jgi:hypothetical protein
MKKLLLILLITLATCTSIEENYDDVVLEKKFRIKNPIKSIKKSVKKIIKNPIKSIKNSAKKIIKNPINIITAPISPINIVKTPFNNIIKKSINKAIKKPINKIIKKPIDKIIKKPIDKIIKKPIDKIIKKPINKIIKKPIDKIIKKPIDNIVKKPIDNTIKKPKEIIKKIENIAKQPEKVIKQRVKDILKKPIKGLNGLFKGKLGVAFRKLSTIVKKGIAWLKEKNLWNPLVQQLKSLGQKYGNEFCEKYLPSEICGKAVDFVLDHVIKEEGN